MSAAAINTASAPSAPGAAGPGVGPATVGATGHTQALGLPAIFEAMMATMLAADAAAVSGGATGAVGAAKAGGKLAFDALKSAPALGEGKGKATGADADKPDAAPAANPNQNTLAAALMTPAVPAPPTPANAATGSTESADPDAIETGLPQVASGKTGPASPKGLPASTAANTVEADADADQEPAPAVTGMAIDASTTAPILDGGAAKALPTAATVAAAPQPSSPATTTPQAKPPAPAPAEAQVQAQPNVTAAQQQVASEAPAAPQAPSALAAQMDTAAIQGQTPQSGRPADPAQPSVTPAKSAGSRTTRADTGKAPALGATPNGLASGAAASTKPQALAVQGLADPLSKPASADDDAEASAAPANDAQSGDPSLFTPATTDPTAAPVATAANVTHAAATAVRGSPQTVANLTAQIVKKLDARQTEFDVQLHPAGLGKVDVRVAIGSDGKMSAALSFDSPRAAAELKSRANELQQALEQSGFDLSGGMSFDVANGGGQNGQAQQQQADNGAVFRGRAFQSALDTVDAAPAPQLIPQRSALSGVDIRI